MDTIQVSSSHAAATEDAVAELVGPLADDSYALVFFFVSDRHDPHTLAAGLRQALPTTPIVGCTTAGEIGPAGYQTDSVVAVAFPHSSFVAATDIIPNLSTLDLGECERRVEDLRCRVTLLAESRGFTSTLAFLLVDGLSRREEPLGRAIQLVLGDMPVIGGSAGDSLQFTQTMVVQDGKASSDAAVIAILATHLPCRILKTQHFQRTHERMVVTEARPAERIVTEINGLPAAAEYARIVGIPVANLNPMAFAAYPVVVRIGGREYVRSIQKVNADGSLSFYCAIDEGIVLSRAQGLDALANLEQALDSVVAEIGPPQLVLACDCILRRLEFNQNGQTEIISSALRERRVIGFSTFGELHMGIHVNQTLTGVAFGQPPQWTTQRMS